MVPNIAKLAQTLNKHLKKAQFFQFRHDKHKLWAREDVKKNWERLPVLELSSSKDKIPLIARPATLRWRVSYYENKKETAYSLPVTGQDHFVTADRRYDTEEKERLESGINIIYTKTTFGRLVFYHKDQISSNGTGNKLKRVLKPSTQLDAQAYKAWFWNGGQAKNILQRHRHNF